MGFIVEICVQKNNLNSFKISVDFLKTTDIHRFYLGNEFDNSYLTRKEMEVLGLLINGQTTVQIAKQFRLSVKTLEQHVKSIKIKFKCNTLFELGFKAAKLNFNLITGEEESTGITYH